MPSKLAQLQEQVAAVSKKIHDTFDAAGEDLDFAKAAVLEITGATDAKGAVAKLGEWNKEAEDKSKELRSVDELDRQKQLADQRIAEAEEFARKHKTPVNLPPLPGGGGGGGDQGAGTKTLGQIVVESAAFRGYKDARTPQSSIVEGYGLKELKTLFQTTAGWTPESTRIPGLLIEGRTRPIQITDLIPPGTTGMATVKYMEETTRTHAAAERSEGAAYAESTFVVAEKSEDVRTVGDSIPVTDEQLEDVDGVRSYLDSRLVFGNRQRIDNQVINGNGTAPNLRGILNVVGIQTQAKGSDPIFDAVHKAMTLVRVTGRAFPDAVIFHPNEFEKVKLTRTADGVYLWGHPSMIGPQTIWGVPVVLSDAIAAGTALVGDYLNFSQLYERRGMMVEVGYVDTQFTGGKRTIRAGVRVAMVTYRPTAFAKVTGL